MMKEAKKLLTITIALATLLLTSSCASNEYEKGYSAGYDEGYALGYEAGYSETYFDAHADGYFSGKDDGVEDTLDYVANALYDELWNLERKTAEKYGLHPDEAAAVLDDFINGKYVSEEELQIAIDSICGYYYDSFNLPDEIEDMDLYID